MNVRHYLRPPPRPMRRRLFTDALVLWLGVRIFALLFAAGETPSPLLPAPRTSLVIVTAAVFLCLVQVRRFRETHFLRNLGVSLPGQLLFAAVIVGILEVTARILLQFVLSPGGPR